MSGYIFNSSEEVKMDTDSAIAELVKILKRILNSGKGHCLMQDSIAFTTSKRKVKSPKHG